MWIATHFCFNMYMYTLMTVWVVILSPYFMQHFQSDKLNTTCTSVVPQNRTGQLCGKCIDGYAPAVYSYGIQSQSRLFQLSPQPVQVCVCINSLSSCHSPVLISGYILQIKCNSSFYECLDLYLLLSWFHPHSWGYLYTHSANSANGMILSTFLCSVWNLDFFCLAFVFTPVFQLFKWFPWTV